MSDMGKALEKVDTNDFLHPYNLVQLADDTMLMAEYFDSLTKKFAALFEYSRKKYQIANFKKTVYAHFSEHPITTPMIIEGSQPIKSIKVDKGHSYLGMLFLPTNDLKKILLFNINSRMKHIAKFYSWLEVNEKTPIETKLLVLDNGAFSAVIYGCEAWGDISCISDKLVATELKLLKAILKIKKGTTNDIVLYELRRSSIVTKIKDKQCHFFKKLFYLPEHVSK